MFSGHPYAKRRGCIRAPRSLTNTCVCIHAYYIYTYYVYIYIYTYIHTYKYKYTHTYMYRSRSLSLSLSLYMYTYTYTPIRMHIYIYIYIHTHIRDGRGHGSHIGGSHVGRFTVGSHDFDSQDFKLRVSNPRTVAYLHLNMPFDGSNLSGAGPMFAGWTLKTGCARTGCTGTLVHAHVLHALGYGFGSCEDSWVIVRRYKFQVHGLHGYVSYESRVRLKGYSGPFQSSETIMMMLYFSSTLFNGTPLAFTCKQSTVERVRSLSELWQFHDGCICICLSHHY